MPEALTMTLEQVLELQQQNARMREALEAVVACASAHVDAMPNARTVPRNLAAGAVLALQGLAESGLE